MAQSAKSRSVPSPWPGNGSRARVGRTEKRDALLRTAARLFIEEGFHTTSLERLAERLGITKPTLYYYFRNKDDILFQCEDIAAKNVLQWITEALESDGASLTSLVAFFRKYIEAVSDDRLRCFILIEEAALSPASRRRIRRSERRINDLTRQLIERGVEDGSIAPLDSKLATFTLFGAVNWIAHWYRPDGELSPAEIAEQMTRQFVCGLAPRP